jgi:hypothetical protein
MEELFISDSLREAQARLDYMKDKGGFVLISGAAGVGKTTLVRSFAESLDAKFFKIAYAPLSTPLRVCHRILPPTIFPAGRGYTLPKRLALSYHPGYHHGNFLKNENFFELQLISNFNFDSLSPALFILIAQPHLVERLKRPAFEAFYQRITLKIVVSCAAFHIKRNPTLYFPGDKKCICICIRSRSHIEESKSST